MVVFVIVFLVGCEDGLDFDLCGSLGFGFDIMLVVFGVMVDCLDIDNCGIILYLNYQVVVVCCGDIVCDVVNCVGILVEELVDYNLLVIYDCLCSGEVFLLFDCVVEFFL